MPKGAILLRKVNATTGVLGAQAGGLPLLDH